MKQLIAGAISGSIVGWLVATVFHAAPERATGLGRDLDLARTAPASSLEDRRPPRERPSARVPAPEKLDPARELFRAAVLALPVELAQTRAERRSGEDALARALEDGDVTALIAPQHVFVRCTSGELLDHGHPRSELQKDLSELFYAFGK